MLAVVAVSCSMLLSSNLLMLYSGPEFDMVAARVRQSYMIFSI